MRVCFGGRALLCAFAVLAYVCGGCVSAEDAVGVVDQAGASPDVSCAAIHEEPIAFCDDKDVRAFVREGKEKNVSKKTQRLVDLLRLYHPDTLIAAQTGQAELEQWQEADRLLNIRKLTGGLSLGRGTGDVWVVNLNLQYQAVFEYDVPGKCLKLWIRNEK